MARRINPEGLVNTVPAPAAELLEFIRGVEAGRSGYEAVYGHKQKRLPKPITRMTLDEVEANGPWRTRNFGSSAAGAYQFMRDTLDKPGTLRDIEGEMGLSGKELFTPDLQDRMAFHLLKRRGYAEFMAGRINTTEFGKRLAMEWASLPVLASTKGAHQWVSRGVSYYDGDQLNKSLVTPERVETVLARVKAAGGVPTPQPKPSKTKDAAGGAVVVGTGAAVASQDDGSGLLIGLAVALVVLAFIGFLIWRKRESIGAKLRAFKEKL